MSSSQQENHLTPLLTEEDAEIHLLRAQRITVRIWTSSGHPEYQGANVGHVSIETETPLRYMSLWPKQQLLDSDGKPLLEEHKGELKSVSAKEREGWGVFSGISGEFLPSLSTDLTYERRPPEVIYCFYTLKTDAMVARFDDLKKQHTAWTLIPGVTDTAKSCASLAWELLSLAGIGKLLSKEEMSSIAGRGSSVGAAYASKPKSSHTLFFKKESVDSKETKISSKGGSFYSSELLASFLVKSPDALQQFLAQAKYKEIEKTPLVKKISFKGETVVQHISSSSLSGDCKIL